MSRVLLLVFLMIFTDAAFAYNAECAYERSRLKSIQNAMRTIYNSQNIIEEEQKRYATFRNCMEMIKSGKSSKFAKSQKNTKNKKKRFPANTRSSINNKNSFQKAPQRKYKVQPRSSNTKRSYQQSSSNKRKIEK